MKKERKEIENNLYDLCKRVVEEQNLKLYDLEYFSPQKLLRIFIEDEKTGTAVIDDCVKIDKAMTPYIESLEWIPDALTLEVSSPGVYRSLKTYDHFKRAEGRFVKIELVSKMDNDSSEYADLPKRLIGSRKIKALLVETKEEEIDLDIKGYRFSINFNQIKKANLE